MCVYATVSSIWSMLSVLHIPVQISYGYTFLFLSHPLSPQCSPSKGRRRGYCWCVDKYGQPIPGYDGKEKVHCINMETKWREERGRAVETGRQRGISPLKNYMNTNAKVLSQSWPPTCMLRHWLTWPATHFTLQESGENERRRQRECHVFSFGLYPEREVWTESKVQANFNSVTARYVWAYVLLCKRGTLCTCSVSLFCYSMYHSLPAALSVSPTSCFCPPGVGSFKLGMLSGIRRL